MHLGTLRTALATCLLLTAGCANVEPGPAGVPRLGVRTFLDVRHLCSLGVSPPIAIDGAPGPGLYRVRLTNTSVLFGPPSDYDVMVEGDQIAEGALEGYRGICPGEMQIFSIRIEVAARDAQGRTTAYGYTTVNANSTTRILRMAPNERPRMPARQSP